METDQSEDVDAYLPNDMWKDLPSESRKRAIELLVQMIYKMVLTDQESNTMENNDRPKVDL